MERESQEVMAEFLPQGGSFDGVFPDLDFTFSEERTKVREWLKGNSQYLIAPLALSLISADAIEHFSWTPTVLGGIAGGLGGFFWELADGSSAAKVHGVRTEQGVGLTREGSSFSELFVSVLGGGLAGASIGAGLTKGIDSKLAYALGLLGTQPGLLLCRATKQKIWPLRK